jgi:hypothetical protein
MKKITICLIALAICGKVFCQENQEKKTREVEPTKSMIDYQLALDLSNYGYQNKDALSLIQAAKILLANPPKELKTTKTENTENKNETDKKTTKAIVVDPKTLLADAKKLANNDKKILELITATNKTISATRGRTFGPAYCERKVYSNSTCTDYILFEGGSKAEVAISGDGDNDLDLYVYDENNNLIAKDDDYTDRCYVSFYPKWEGSFKIVVKNRGSRVYSNYILRSN